MKSKMPTVCFDLEGPLSGQDNAFEVLALVEDGDKIFEVLSRYDDLLTLEGREGYEPGDTLKLIVPFLVHHGISEEDIRKVSRRATLVPGIQETIGYLKGTGWKVHVISTSYAQHAFSIAGRLGLGREDVACTEMPLDRYLEEFPEGIVEVESIEKLILEELYPPESDQKIVKALDRFYFKTLPGTKAWKVFSEIQVVGGSRKVEAMLDFMEKDGADFESTAAVGDSITDFKMLALLREKGGLAVAFNGNAYSIPHADVTAAAQDFRFLLPIFEAFKFGGKIRAKEAAVALTSDKKAILEKLPPGVPAPEESLLPPVFHTPQPDTDTENIVKIHRKFRELLRGEAAKLG